MWNSNFSLNQKYMFELRRVLVHNFIHYCNFMHIPLVLFRRERISWHSWQSWRRSTANPFPFQASFRIPAPAADCPFSSIGARKGWGALFALEEMSTFSSPSSYSFSHHYHSLIASLLSNNIAESLLPQPFGITLPKDVLEISQCHSF